MTAACDAAFRLGPQVARCDREALHDEKDDVGHAVGSSPRTLCCPHCPEDCEGDDHDDVPCEVCTSDDTPPTESAPASDDTRDQT